MATASFTFQTLGANSVVNANNQISASQKQLAGTSKKSGMAILEASRGLEDFAMAGMRGVMNNIPGLLQNLGVGMGLTGAISMVTVAAYVARNPAESPAIFPTFPATRLSWRTR